MKKILSLFTAITLTISGSSSVISCDTKTKDNDNNKKEVNKIINKLKNTKIKLNINIAAAQKIIFYKTDIKTQLNKKLSQAEINAYDIFFTNPNQTLTNAFQDVNIQIKIGTYTSPVNIKISFNFWKVDSIASNAKVNAAAETSARKYIGTTRGLYESPNGSFFSKVAGDLAIKNITAIKQINNKVYVGTTSGLYVSSSTGFLKVNSINNIKQIIEINSKVYVGTTNGLYVLTTGTTFTPVNGELATDYINIIKPIGVGNNLKIYVGTNYGLFISSDAIGTSFGRIAGAGDISIEDILVINEINSKIYVGTFQNGLYVSTNASKTTFSKVNLILTNLEIRSIEAINNKIYIGTYGRGLFVSSDIQGTSFTNDNSILNTAKIITIKKGKNILYIGTENGLYSKDSTEINFSKVSGYLSTTSISLINELSSKIYVGTDQGLYLDFI